MKKILLALTLFATACSKDSDDSSKKDASAPTVTNVRFGPVYAGANESVKFDFDVTVPDTTAVKKLLLRRPNLSVIVEINNPRTGHYIKYDHVGDYPGYEEGSWYVFEYKMTNGGSIAFDPFQVY